MLIDVYAQKRRRYLNKDDLMNALTRENIQKQPMREIFL